MTIKLALSCLIPITLAATTFAQTTSDAPPVNVPELLAALKQLRELNQKGINARRTDALQRVTAAAASGEKAAAFWKDAVKVVQFQGAKQEGAQIRDWRDGDGDALNDKLGQNAARLHLNWLAITLKRSAGAEVSTLLPAIIDHVKQVQADEIAAEHFSEQLQKARERDSKSPGARRNLQEDSVVRRVHDQILRMSVAESPVARWLQIEEIVEEAGGVKSKKPGAPAAAWENIPGSVFGIYGAIILPEFRATKDPRLLEYWDMVLKRETERMATRTLDVEQREWTLEKRPRLLWQRSQDVLLLGQRNRAIGEMFNIIKTVPNHPDAPGWIDSLQALLVPSSAEPLAVPEATTAPAPGAVTPPVPVPSATVLPPGATIPPK